MRGGDVQLGEGGAGSGSASGGVPRPDSAVAAGRTPAGEMAAAQAWPGSAGPSAQSGARSFFFKRSTVNKS